MTTEYQQELMSLLNEVAEGTTSPTNAYDEIMNKWYAVTQSSTFQDETDDIEANSDSMNNE